MLVAIHPDDYTNPKTGLDDASSPRWAELLRRAGHEVKWVDVFKPDILNELRGCDGFMWRHVHLAKHRIIARRLIPVLERQLGLCVYPDANTSWHYDDKVAQKYLLEAAGLPIPRTRVFWDHDDALEFCRSATYPMVLKLSGGASGQNVILLNDFTDARRWTDRLFGSGVFSLGSPPAPNFRLLLSRLRPIARWLLRGRVPTPGVWFELHKHYVLLQEFLPGNEFDTRVVVIGRRAFAQRRFNRPQDFRASGSGTRDLDPTKIDLETVRLGFQVARALNTQSIAIDGMRRGDERVIGEISYNYVSWVVRAIPGHWELRGYPDDGELEWVDGPMWPEEAQMEDYLVRLESWDGERQRDRSCQVEE